MRSLVVRLAKLASMGVLLWGCTPAPREAPPRDEPAGAPPAARSHEEVTAPVDAAHLVFVEADGGDLREQVRALITRARAEGRSPLVYVGASWCEPCQYFHAAALRGDLDEALPPLLLLELDRDRDGARLDAAGYASRMIPLFVAPNDDGTPSEARIEGSIHGPGSPAQIVPRLLPILRPIAAAP